MRNGWVGGVDEQGRQHEAESDRDRRRRSSPPGTGGRPGDVRAGMSRSEGCERPCATLRSTSARSSRRQPSLDSPRIGGPSRGADAPTRTTWTREGAVAILAVLGLALAARLIIAYAFPGTGLKFDLDSFHAWAANLARDGLYGFYDRDFFLDYTPGYLYVLYLVGLARPGDAAASAT